MENEAVVFSQVQSILKEDLINTVHRICDANKQEDSTGLSNKIADELVAKAIEVSPNFKYIVNCSLSEGGTDQLTTHGTAYWDAQMDGCVNFTLRKNDCLILVTVFVVAL